MLVMILFMNTVSNVSIAILMADLQGDIAGFLISTFTIVVVSEIVPQTIGNRFPIALSHYLKYFMWFYFIVTSPVSFLIGGILQKVLGDGGGNLLKKSEMKKLFEHQESQKILKASERKILIAALELKNRTIA